jgi:hypothetical protein
LDYEAKSDPFIAVRGDCDNGLLFRNMDQELSLSATPASVENPTERVFIPRLVGVGDSVFLQEPGYSDRV